LITTLSLHRLELPVLLGWPEEERSEKQIVFVDIHFAFTQPPLAFKTDELNDTICYQTLIHEIQTFVHNKSFRLVEFFCNELHQFIKSKHPAANLSIIVKKYPPIAELTEGVTVSCTDC